MKEESPRELLVDKKMHALLAVNNSFGLITFTNKKPLHVNFKT